MIFVRQRKAKSIVSGSHLTSGGFRSVICSLPKNCLPLGRGEVGPSNATEASIFVSFGACSDDIRGLTERYIINLGIQMGIEPRGEEDICLDD